MRKLLALAAVAAAALAAVPAFAATRTVRVADDVFRPSSLSANRGDTIRFRWVGDNPHNVVVARGPVKFRSSTKDSGTFSRRVRRRGTYRIVCTVHSGMRMTLRVR
jgi:plastocyanin